MFENCNELINGETVKELLPFTEGDGSVLKENLIDELEYVLFPEEAWQKLVSWYGVQSEQVGGDWFTFQFCNNL